MRVLFGWKPEWRKGCEAGARAAGFSPEMEPLAAVNLADFDAVVPLVLADHAIIERFRAGGGTVRAIVMPEIQRGICHDKLAFSIHMEAKGFGAFVPRRLDPAHLSPRDFPLVVKARAEAYGRGTCVVQKVEDLQAHLPALANGHAFLQELVPGDAEFAAHLLMHEGMLVYSALVHYKMPVPNVIKGHAWRPMSRHWPAWSPHKPLWFDILRSLGIRSGTLCIDYRLRNGQPVIFEINPRAGASLTHRISDYLAVYLSCAGRGPAIAFG